MELILISTTGLFFMFLSFFKARRLINPISIIIFIWFSLLVLSNLSLTGLDVARPYTKLLLLFSFSALVFGSFCSFPYVCADKTFYRNKFALVLSVIVAAAPLVLVGIYVVKVILGSGYYGYLYVTRWADASIVDSYGSVGIFAYMFNVSRPIIYAYFFISAALYFNENKRLNLFFSGALMLSLAFILSARAEAVTVVFVMMVGVLLGGNKLSRSSLAFFIIFSGSMLFYILFLSYSRTGGLLAIADIFNRYAIDYHTLGFTMFDKALHDEESLIHSIKSYGLATVSGLGFLVKQVFRAFGEVYLHPSALLRAEMSEPIAVGFSYATNEIKESNAFYTAFYGFYADFGYVGMLVFPFVFGFFLMRHYLSYLKSQASYSFAMILFLTWTGYNSLFHPAILSDYWWFALGLIFVFGRVRLYVNRNTKVDYSNV